MLYDTETEKNTENANVSAVNPKDNMETNEKKDADLSETEEESEKDWSAQN